VNNQINKLHINKQHAVVGALAPVFRNSTASNCFQEAQILKTKASSRSSIMHHIPIATKIFASY